MIDITISSEHLGDCLEIMPSIPDKSIDMILCDLPYGTTSCKWDTIVPFEPLWNQYERIIKDNGAIVLTASQPFTSSLVMSNAKAFKFSWVWNKKFAGNFVLAKYQPQKIHEDILVFSYGTTIFNAQKSKRDVPCKKGANKDKIGAAIHIANLKDEYKNKVYEFKEPESILLFSSREGKRFHPTQKPVALFEYLIKTYTKEEAIVLDNCAGSFTTAIACLNTNRNYICIEKEEEYYKKGCQRIIDWYSEDK